MDRESNISQENQPDIPAAIARLQASVDKLQSILTSPQAQAEIQAKMAASAEQAMARFQAKLVSGQMAMFSPSPQNSGIPTLTNPYNTASIDHAAALSTNKALNNATAPTVQKEIMEVLESSLNNPHRAEMETLALQAVIDSANNPHWDQANALVADCLADAMKNPWLTNNFSSLISQNHSSSLDPDKPNKSNKVSGVSSNQPDELYNNAIGKLPERVMLVDDPEWLPLNSEENNMVTGLSEAIKIWRHQQAVNIKNPDFNEIFSIDEKSCYRYKNRLAEGPTINMSDVLGVIKEIKTPQETSRSDLFSGFHIDASSIAEHATRIANSEKVEKDNQKVDWAFSEYVIGKCRNKNLCPLSLDDLAQAKLLAEISKENGSLDSKSELWTNFFESMLVGWVGSTNNFFLSEVVSQALLKNKDILQYNKEQQATNLSYIVEKLTHHVNGPIDILDNSGVGVINSSYKNMNQADHINIPYDSGEEKIPGEKFLE